MAFALLNKLTAKPGRRGEVVELLLESGKLLAGNRACLLYLVSESTTDPDVVWVQDLWTSKEEHEVFLRQPDLKPFVTRTMPLLEGRPEQLEIRPVGGKGLQHPSTSQP